MFLSFLMIRTILVSLLMGKELSKNGIFRPQRGRSILEYWNFEIIPKHRFPTAERSKYIRILEF